MTLHPMPPSRGRSALPLALALILACLLAVPGRACERAACEEVYFGRINGFPSDLVTAVTSDPAGNIFVGTEDKGLVVIPAGTLQWSENIGKDQGLTFEAIHSLWVDPDDKLWIGTAGGLNAMEPGSGNVGAGTFFAEDGLKDNICLSITQRADASELWIGTTRGLVMKRGGFTCFTEKDGLPTDHIQSLTTDQAGTLWIGTSGGLARRRQDTFEAVPLPAAKPREVVTPWINDLLSIPSERARFPAKIRRAYDDLLTGVRRRFRQDETASATQDLVNTLQSFRDRLSRLRTYPLFAATTDGLFAMDPDRTGFERLLDGWFTAIAISPNGRTFVARNDLTVVQAGRAISFVSDFNLAEMITEKIRACLHSLLTEAGKGSPTQEATRVFVENLRQAGITDLDTWLAGFMSGLKVSGMCFSPQGHLWVAIHGAGLFRFRPLFINDDAAAYAFLFASDDLASPPDADPAISVGTRTSRGKAMGFRLSSRKPAVPDIPEIREGLVKARSILPFDSVWIGPWSALNSKDARKVAEFIGQYSHEICIARLGEALPEDPIVILPLGDY